MCVCVCTAVQVHAIYCNVHICMENSLKCNRFTLLPVGLWPSMLSMKQRMRIAQEVVFFCRDNVQHYSVGVWECTPKNLFWFKYFDFQCKCECRSIPYAIKKRSLSFIEWHSEEKVREWEWGKEIDDISEQTEPKY